MKITSYSVLVSVNQAHYLQARRMELIPLVNRTTHN